MNKVLSRDGAMGLLPQEYHLFTEDKSKQIIFCNIHVITESMPNIKNKLLFNVGYAIHSKKRIKLNFFPFFVSDFLF